MLSTYAVLLGSVSAPIGRWSPLSLEARWEVPLALLVVCWEEMHIINRLIHPLCHNHYHHLHHFLLVVVESPMRLRIRIQAVLFITTVVQHVAGGCEMSVILLSEFNMFLQLDN